MAEYGSWASTVFSIKQHFPGRAIERTKIPKGTAKKRYLAQTYFWENPYRVKQLYRFL